MEKELEVKQEEKKGVVNNNPLYLKMNKTEIEKIIKLINRFEKRHKKIFKTPDGDFYCDCPIIENQARRISSRKDWLGDDESWKRSKREEKERDKNIRCFSCKFIQKMKRNLQK